MATQSNPLIDDSLVEFLLYSVLDDEGLCKLGAYEQHSKETFDLYIDSVRRFARQDLLPMNRCYSIPTARRSARSCKCGRAI